MPKRSTGCFECRKRKVRCDESKPECNTCLKRGTKCPGYRPTQAFILHEFDTKRDKPALIKEDEDRYKFAIQSDSRSKQQGKSQSNRGIRIESVQYEPDIPKQVSLVASERIQHVSTFVALYLPKTEGQALPGPSALMLGLPNLPANSPVLEAAIDALAAAQLAVDKMNSPLIHRSRSLYSTALSQMLHAIQDQETALKDETLLSTYLLSLYEVTIQHYSIQSTLLTFPAGVCRRNTGPWLLLPHTRSIASREAARTIFLRKQIKHANLPWNPIQLCMINPTSHASLHLLSPHS